MKFTLTMKCDNAAFNDDHENNNPDVALVEVGRILREISGPMKSGIASRTGTLRDANGNTVGRYELTTIKQG